VNELVSRYIMHVCEDSAIVALQVVRGLDRRRAVDHSAAIGVAGSSIIFRVATPVWFMWHAFYTFFAFFGHCMWCAVRRTPSNALIQTNEAAAQWLNAKHRSVNSTGGFCPDYVALTLLWEVSLTHTFESLDLWVNWRSFVDFLYPFPPVVSSWQKQKST